MSIGSVGRERGLGLGDEEDGDARARGEQPADRGRALDVDAEDDDARAESAGEAEFLIAKQRNGPTGGVPLTFRKEFMRFEDREGEVSEI